MFKEISVLYVDDELSLSNIVSNSIGSLFKNFYIQNNGKEGLDFFKKNQDNIDIVITDINMPIMNGIQMSEEIRKIDHQLPIIITSAHNENSYLHQAIKLQISGYILKPLDVLKLFECIEKVLEPKILKEKLKTQNEEYQESLLQNAKFSAIGELSAGLIHEINTPLTYIKGSLEISDCHLSLLDDTPTKLNLLKAYDRIKDGANRIENIVDSMKEMANMSNNNKEKVNLYETIITSAVITYNKMKHISQIFINGELFTIESNKNFQIVNAYVQKQRIEQVWIIIINNALDELQKIPLFKNRRLDINIEDSEDEIIIKFEDNAGGIKDEIYDKVFESFKSTKESSGMGVGLSIAKKIIEAQNGTISAYNKNDGAVFEVILNKNSKENIIN